jgi:undecaprenyl diphosphate synthase
MEKKIEHLAIIMDGNRRWAKDRGLPSFEGHRAGYDKVKDVVKWCQETDIKILTVFAFSTENWQRAKSEVDFLMEIFHFFFTREIQEVHKNNIRVKVIGHKESLSPALQKAIQESEELTKNNTSLILNLAISYGGHQELADAMNDILKNPPEIITKETIAEHLYTTGLPDPDMIVRTSGESRLSGFLTWQSAYSELHFIDKHWPDFSKQDLEDTLTEFANRQRRFGK